MCLPFSILTTSAVQYAYNTLLYNAYTVAKARRRKHLANHWQIPDKHMNTTAITNPDGRELTLKRSTADSARSLLPSYSAAPRRLLSRPHARPRCSLP